MRMKSSWPNFLDFARNFRDYTDNLQKDTRFLRNFYKSTSKNDICSWINLKSMYEVHKIKKKNVLLTC